jgi:hypothetical protein
MSKSYSRRKRELEVVCYLLITDGKDDSGCVLANFDGRWQLPRIEIAFADEEDIKLSAEEMELLAQAFREKCSCEKISEEVAEKLYQDMLGQALWRKREEAWKRKVEAMRIFGLEVRVGRQLTNFRHRFSRGAVKRVFIYEANPVCGRLCRTPEVRDVIKSSSPTSQNLSSFARLLFRKLRRGREGLKKFSTGRPRKRMQSGAHYTRPPRKRM